MPVECNDPPRYLDCDVKVMYEGGVCLLPYSMASRTVTLSAEPSMIRRHYLSLLPLNTYQLNDNEATPYQARNPIKGSDPEGMF